MQSASTLRVFSGSADALPPFSRKGQMSLSKAPKYVAWTHHLATSPQTTTPSTPMPRSSSARPVPWKAFISVLWTTGSPSR